METYESSVTAEQLERALDKSVFSVNGKTGDVSLGASDVKAVPLPSVAEVGQTIVVTAVDENGVPTAWAANNLPVGGTAKRVVHSLTLDEDADTVVINTDDNGQPFECHALLVITETISYEDSASYVVFIPNGIWANGTYLQGGMQTNASSAGFYTLNMVMSYAIPGEPYNVFAGYNIWQPYMLSQNFHKYHSRSTLENRASITSYKFSGKFAAGSKFTLIEVG